MNKTKRMLHILFSMCIMLCTINWSQTSDHTEGTALVRENSNQESRIRRFWEDTCSGKASMCVILTETILTYVHCCHVPSNLLFVLIFPLPGDFNDSIIASQNIYFQALLLISLSGMRCLHPLSLVVNLACGLNVKTLSSNPLLDGLQLTSHSQSQHLNFEQKREVHPGQ